MCSSARSAGTAAGRAAEDQPGLCTWSREGRRFIRHSRLVGGLIIGLVGAFAAGGAVIGAGKIFVTSLGGGNAAYGVLFGSVFVGLGSGMAFGPRIARELSRRRLFGLSIVFAAICLILTAVMPQVALAMIFVLGLGFGAGVAYLAGMTLMGTDVEDEMRGRVFAVLQSLIRVVLMLALAAVPFVVAQVGAHTISHRQRSATRRRHADRPDRRRRCSPWRPAARLPQDGRPPAGRRSGRTSRPRCAATPSARRRMRSGGVFVAFEGGEGVGQVDADRAARRCAARQGIRRPRHARARRDTDVGARIRSLLLHDRRAPSPRGPRRCCSPPTARTTSNRDPAGADAGQWCSRIATSTRHWPIRASAGTCPIDEVRRVSRWATAGLLPDLTVLLDLPADEGLARMRDGRRRDATDKLEAESVGVPRAGAQAFRMLAESEPRRYLVIDAREPAEAIAAQIRTRVEGLLTPRRPARLRSSTPRSGAGAAPGRAAMSER